jgi:2-iminobutanoate/2-iminopropanoate deaminase
MKTLSIVAIALAFLAGVAAARGTVRKYIYLPSRTEQPRLPYSDAVLVGDTLHLAGRIGLDPATGKPPADVNQEVKLLLDGFGQVLGQAGMSYDDLVSVQIACPDLSLYEKFNSQYAKRFTKDPPARAFLGSGQLLRGAHFEMLGIAVKR